MYLNLRTYSYETLLGLWSIEDPISTVDVNLYISITQIMGYSKADVFY